MDVLNQNLLSSLLDLIKVTSSELPKEVLNAITKYSEQEEEGTAAKWAMQIIKENIQLAKTKSAPLCQDTGTLLLFVKHSPEMSITNFRNVTNMAIVKATELGYLRQNSVDSLSGKNSGQNLGPGHPTLYFEEQVTDSKAKNFSCEVTLMMKGGGCENVGAQYSLPYTKLNAGRDLKGVRKVILESVLMAQGQGCAPGVLGVCIGGDRSAGYVESKHQLLRKLDDVNPVPELQELEEDILSSANKLGIGPLGFGGKTTLLGVKIGCLNRLPASYFVSISYMCWAYRRQGVCLGADNQIISWCY